MNINVPRIKAFKVGTDELDIDTLLRYPFEDVSEASELLPAAMSWLGTQRGYFKGLLIQAELDLKATKARLYFNYRQNGIESEGLAGKQTEAAIEHAINMHPDLKLQVEIVARYEKVVSQLNTHIEALSYKIELVRTGEATNRRTTDQGSMTDEELAARAQAAKTE